MRVKSRLSCRLRGVGALGALTALAASAAIAQPAGFAAASIEPHPGVRITGSGPVRVPVGVRIRRGYHINSNRPNDKFLIATELAWHEPPFAVDAIAYPPAEELRTRFSAVPLAVFSSRIEIVTTFQVGEAPRQARELRGSLRFQACTDRACLPPRTIPVTVPLRR